MLEQPYVKFVPRVSVIIIMMALTACGGGGEGGNGGSNDEGALPNLTINQLKLAQTHLIPATGLSITGSDDTSTADELELHMVGNRAALALVELSPTEVDGLMVEGRIGDTDLGSVSLQDNSALPITESGGARQSDSAFVADIPSSWLQSGLQLRTNAAAAEPSDWQPITVGADPSYTVHVLPMYLFGADDEDVPFADVSAPSQTIQDEMFAKIATSTLEAVNHSAVRLDWPSVVVSPRGDVPAYVMDDVDDELSSFDTLSAGLQTIRALRSANGDGRMASHDYGVMVLADASGNLASTGGGLGGGDTAVGGTAFGGVFIHELGHAFGMPHAGSSYDDNGGYPYVGGSLDGSVASYDQHRRVFQPVQVPSNANRFSGCESDTFGGTPRQVDGNNDCVRQDPMQSGSGDQADGDAFTTFSDYNAGVMQRYFEGQTTEEVNGDHRYSGGKLFIDPASSSGYSRWDTIDLNYVDVDPTTLGRNGLDGINGNIPEQRDVSVYRVVGTISNAGTTGATQIYPVVGPSSGNLLRLIDPNSASDRADIVPDSSADYRHYCKGRGCDYTLRAVYLGGVIRDVLLNKGFRNFFPDYATADPNEDTVRDCDSNDDCALDANSSTSFEIFAVNLPADLVLQSVSLLSTPRGFDGISASPPVLATRLVN